MCPNKRKCLLSSTVVAYSTACYFAFISAGDNDKIKGCWDSIHVVEVQVYCQLVTNTLTKAQNLCYVKAGLWFFFISQEKSSGRQAHYKLTSTVMLWLQVWVNSTSTSDEEFLVVDIVFVAPCQGFAIFSVWVLMLFT